jgi:hypothetical protein
MRIGRSACKGWLPSISLAVLTLLHGAAQSRADVAVGPLERIPAGTSIWDAKSQGFSNVILFVTGKLAAGDLSAANDTTKYYAELFNLAYLAKVAPAPQGGYKLDRIAVGFSTKINGKDIAVTADTANQLGARLSLIGRSVLSGNENALQDLVVLATSPTFAVVDAPGVFYYQMKHQQMVVRFCIWVSPEGKLGTVCWLLQKAAGGLAFAENTFQFLPPSMVENRQMHVDGSRFTFGIPSADAFAIMTIPQGKAYPITDRLRRFGSATQYTPDSLNELAASLSEAMTTK